MEEIIDIDELAEKEQNEKIKEYLKEDETVSKELTEKINELTEEKTKLSIKSVELNEKEESLRDKLTHDAKTDEIRKVADEIDNLKSEMVTITENVERLENELKEIQNAKIKTEETKTQYKEKISSTIGEYEKKISTIEAAIKVCDNEYLKKAQEEELSKMKETLENMKEERSRELKETLNITISKNSSEISQDNILNKDKPISKSILDEIEVSPLNTDIGNKQKELSNETIPIDSFNDTISYPVDIDIKEETKAPMEESKEELKNTSPLDFTSLVENNIEESGTSSVIQDIKPTVDLNSGTLFNYKTEKNKDFHEISKIDDVPEDKIRDIFSSSGILPIVYDYLNNNKKVGV